MSYPLVSIIINNYNFDRYLGASIESAVAQDYPNKEIVVVDDGSTDDSRGVIESYGPAIRAVFKANGGQASAFNEGFAKSHGEIICFLDSDDAFLPTKVSQVVSIMSAHSVDWCFHSLQWTDSNLNIVSGPPAIPYKTGRYDFRAESSRGTCTFRAPATSGLVFSRQLLKSLLPMPPEIRITSDNYLKLSALALSPGYFMRERLTLQRLHGANAYTAKKNDPLRAHIQLITAICLRDNFPAFRRSWNNMFVTGLVDKWNSGSSIRSTAQTLNDYLVDMPLTERLETLARVVIRALRQSFSSASL